MSSASQPEAGGEAGRIRCLYCGANNFPNLAACWQCSRPLKAVRAASGEVASALGVNVLPPPAAVAPARPAFTESPLAPKAAAALGMLFPFVGLPAGILFLMLDDPRKTQLGWLLIGWSLAGSVLSILSLAATLGPVLALMKGLLPHPGGAGAPEVPGLPSFGGDGTGLLLPVLFMTSHV